MIITGTGFTGVTSVTVGGVPVRSFTVDAPNQISAVLGAGASGAVRVSTPRGNASKDGFVFAAPMQVTTVVGGLGRGPLYIVQDEQKNMYIPMENWGIVYKITPSGTVTKFFTLPAAPCTLTGAIARDKAGFIYLG